MGIEFLGVALKANQFENSIDRGRIGHLALRKQILGLASYRQAESQHVDTLTRFRAVAARWNQAVILRKTAKLDLPGNPHPLTDLGIDGHALDSLDIPTTDAVTLGKSHRFFLLRRKNLTELSNLGFIFYRPKHPITLS